MLMARSGGLWPDEYSSCSDDAALWGCCGSAVPWTAYFFRRIGQIMIRLKITSCHYADPDYDPGQLVPPFSCVLFTAPDAEHTE